MGIIRETAARRHDKTADVKTHHELWLPPYSQEHFVAHRCQCSVVCRLPVVIGHARRPTQGGCVVLNYSTQVATLKKEVRPAPARLPGAPRATPQLPRSVARPCILLATERPLRHHLTAGESKILSEAESLSSPNLNVPVPRPCQWPPASEAHPARCHCSGSGTASEPGPASGSGASRWAEGAHCCATTRP